MNSHIYILTDGANTKIGITTDIDKRMATYRTHNPNIRIFKQFPCSTEESKQVETAIKHIFKTNLSHTSKEWFAITPEEVDRYVSTLLEKPTKTDVLPSMHGVLLTNEAHEIKEKILKLLLEVDSNISNSKIIDDTVKKKNSLLYKEIASSKEKLSEIFANKFALGIPRHNLPENVLEIDSMGIDLNHASINSDATRKAVRANYIELPHDDHVYNFYHLISLSSGHYIAICTARISMPYIGDSMNAIDKQEMVERANEYGFYCTFHNDWSWHSPGTTGLALYQPKTPVATTLRLWDKSFRKWVIERQELLKNEPYVNIEALEKTIEDITWDNTFPLDITSYDDLRDKYLNPFWGIDEDEDFPFFMKDAYSSN